MPIAEDPEPRPAEQPDPFKDLVLDEEFIQGATVKEQSGRARMLAAKWKRQPPEPEAAWRPPTEIRRRWYQRKARRVDPWGNPVKRRRGQGTVRTVAFVLLTVLVVAAALNVNGLHDWYESHYGSDGSPAAQAAPASPRPVVTQAPESAKPTAAPSTEAPQTPTAARPWAGSPADTWPTGADAIVLPDAKATGVFGKDQVAKQLQQAKDFLVAANLDPATLAGGTPQQALDLLERQSRSDVQNELAHPSREHNPDGLFSRFNPRTAVPAVTDVKLQGELTFEGDGKNGVLIHADYTFVYAVVPGPDQYRPSPSGAPGAQSVALLGLDPNAVVTREIVRRQVDFRFYDPAHYDVQRGKLALQSWKVDKGNNYCGADDGWLEPYFATTSAPGTETPDPSHTVDPYDRSKDLPDDGKCGTVSRT
ncbi:hypothetical protein [Streptomyces tateyamensis]|uniref:SCO2583/SCO2584 N-terminal domain-containing protein n=1 Tax=Streptomyces tateyamensis TaxID=565073 RepID=UPI0011B4DE21|nr:hypothetical protein [Streptomyces tateyamensis]